MKNAPYCYGCKGTIHFKIQHVSVHFEEFDGPIGGGEVIRKRIPYCPNCTQEPSDTGVVQETIGETFRRENS